MRKSENIIFIIRKLIILFLAINYTFSLPMFFVVFVADFVLQILGDEIKMSGAQLGFREAAGSNMNYRAFVQFDYLRFNFYFLFFMGIPLLFSSIIYGNFDHYFRYRPVGKILSDEGVLYAMCVIVISQIISCILFYFKKNIKQIHIEEIAHFDFIKLFIFTFLIYISGPLSWWLSGYPDFAFSAAFIILISFIIAIKLFYNKSPENVTE